MLINMVKGERTALDEQSRVRKKILESAHLRRNGCSDIEVLRDVQMMGERKRNKTPKQVARAAYFVGTCLQHKDRAKAIQYYKQALCANPLHYKALYRYISGKLSLT